MDKTIQDIVRQYPKERRYLFSMLREAQHLEGYVSPAAIGEIGRYLDLSENDIYSVASFYGAFHFTRAKDGSGSEQTPATP
jgi:NADH:ubiquinone oxidoreductase subunit E